MPTVMRQRDQRIPVIDLFAGPGGLSEGFSRYPWRKGYPGFKVSLSIEKDPWAHQTLKLRALVRQFTPGRIPEEYYDYLRGKGDRKPGIVSVDELYGCLQKKHPIEVAAAERESWEPVELGAKNSKRVRERIRTALDGTAMWVLIGGPPCQAYSLVGRSRRLGGHNGDAKARQKRLEAFEDLELHTLYREYLRIIRDHRPPIFLMENVKGILSSKLEDSLIFEKILHDLQRPGGHQGSDLEYRLFSIAPRENSEMLFPDISPRQFVIRAEDHGIPQARHRVFVLGVRADLGELCTRAEMASLSKCDPVSLAAVIGDLPRVRSETSGKAFAGRNAEGRILWRRESRDWQEVLDGIPRESWFRELSNSLRRTMQRHLPSDPKLPCGCMFIPEGSGVGLEKLLRGQDVWFKDSRLHGICNHETRRHLASDLQRYFFAACFAENITPHRAPKLNEYPAALLPNHLNAIEGREEDMVFADRFRVQVGDAPATTITSHIAKDGHYYIHPDPEQCRSLTVREAARIQTFPDNYFFEGPRTEQYKQVGNAVPPLLAHKIADLVWKILRQA